MHDRMKAFVRANLSPIELVDRYAPDEYTDIDGECYLLSEIDDLFEEFNPK